MLKKLILVLLFIGTSFWSCEDNQSNQLEEISPNSFIGVWNLSSFGFYSDSNCNGDLEIIAYSGTLTVTETDIINDFYYNGQPAFKDTTNYTLDGTTICLITDSQVCGTLEVTETNMKILIPEFENDGEVECLSIVGVK
jgi:hypothetical protein